MPKRMDLDKPIKTGAKKLFPVIFLSLVSMSSALAVDLRGTVETANGTPLCALALASGKSTFTCNSQGSFNLSDLSTESDGTITLQVYADGFYPNITTLSAFNAQQVVMKPAEICDDGSGGGGGPLTNKQKTESLIGTWDFKFNILSTYEYTYTLKAPAVPFEAFPGDYTVLGTDQYGNPDVNAAYQSDQKNYGLLDLGVTGGVIHRFYRFDYISANNIRGCYYQVDQATEEFSRCYPLTGSRVGFRNGVSNSAPSSKVEETPAQIETRLVREVEAMRLARASLGPKSAETPEEALKRAEAKKRYIEQKNALQGK